MRLSKLALLFTSVLTLACSQSVSLQIKKAPELMLGPVTSLAIGKFTADGNVNVDHVDMGNGLIGAIANATSDAVTNKRARKKNAGIASSYKNQLQNTVATNGYFKAATPKAADAVVKGQIYYTVEDKGSEKERKKDDGSVERWYQLNRQARVDVEFAVYDKSGEVIAASGLRGSANKNTTGGDKQEAINNQDNWEEIVRSALRGTRQTFIKKIAPYYVWETRVFAKGDADEIKDANKLAEDGAWQQAIALWEKYTTAQLAEDRGAAYYNLAIYQEKEGNLQGSLDLMEQARQEGNTSDYDSEIRRIQSRISEQRRLEKAAKEMAKARAEKAKKKAVGTN